MSKHGCRIALAAAFVCATATLTLASQRPNPPSSRPGPPNGQEIAAAARGAKLDTANGTAATMFGKSFKFSPVRSPTRAEGQRQTLDFGKGHFIGVLENGAAGDETGLPPGKYNIFLANVGGRWKSYAEANGRIVGEAIRTTVTPHQEGRPMTPQFVQKGWCIRYYMCGLDVWGPWCYSVMDCW